MIIRGDARQLPLRPATVQCVVTSPPYFQLRDYPCGPRQLGREATPAAYVATLREVFREVRRVLRSDGVLWLILGDSYWNPRARDPGVKRKDLIGIPWRVALALQADGWYLRADIIWHKPNPMPDGARDRPSRAHEHVFLLSKSRRYYYNADAIAEPAVSDHPSGKRGRGRSGRDHGQRGVNTGWMNIGGQRNRRDVWPIASEPTSAAHYATFPAELALLCLLAGSRSGDLVLDPFAGSGTVAAVAEKTSRRWIGIERAAEYVTLACQRTAQIGLPF